MKQNENRHHDEHSSRVSDIIMRCVLPSGLALGLAVMSLLTTTAHASDWKHGLQNPGIDSFEMKPVTPLMTLEVSASTGVLNNDSLDISASLTGVTYQADNQNLGYSQITKAFHVSAPLRSLDFTAEIRERSQLSPQKMLDKMIINGGVGFNLSW